MRKLWRIIVLFAVGMTSHSMVAHPATGDNWKKINCAKHPVNITGNTFSKDKAECYEYTGRADDVHPWKGVELIQFTQDDDYLLILYKRGLFGTNFDPIKEEEMRLAFEAINEWTRQYGYKWSKPRHIKSGMLIQVLGRDNVRSGCCFLYAEQRELRYSGYQVEFFINYCEKDAEFFEDDDVLRILSDVTF